MSMAIPTSAWLAVVWLLCSAARGAAGFDDRILHEIITTTACADIRLASDYPARLDLIYVYSVEFYGALDDLSGMERAIATSVASALNHCSSAANQPVYAVELSDDSAHRIIPPTGAHVPLRTTQSQIASAKAQCLTRADGVVHSVAADNTSLCADQAAHADTHCSLVRGVTSILLENNTAGLDATVRTLIEVTLQDTVFLSQYTSVNLTRAKFERSVAANLVVLPFNNSDSGPQTIGDGTASSSTVRVAVVAAMISFFFTVVFLYGLHRSCRDENREANLAIKDRIARVQAKRRLYFHQLEDDPSLAPGWMVASAPLPTHPTATWSDLTSDSESIISTLPLDRIDEEGAISEDEETCGEEIEMVISGVGSSINAIIPSPAAPNLPVAGFDHSDFIARWNDQTEKAEAASYSNQDAMVAVYFDDADFFARRNNHAGDSEGDDSYPDEEMAEELGHIHDFDQPDASEDHDSYPDEEMAGQLGHIPDFDESIETYVAEPVWFEDDPTPVACNRVPNDTETVTELLRGCSFVYDDDQPGRRKRKAVDPILTSLELSDSDEESAATSRTPFRDITNLAAVSFSDDAETSTDTDPDVSDWARGVLQQLSGSVLLLTCGAEAVAD